MSNRIFQTIIHQMKDVLERTVGIIDENGIVVACSEHGRIGESKQRIREELSYSSDSVVFEGYTYRFITSGGKNENIIFCEGEDRTADRDTKLLAIALGNIKNLYDEKYDKGSFIKSIILDNILPSDIYIKSNELHFDSDGNRAVIVIKFGAVTDVPAYEMVESLMPDRERDYCINIGEQDVVVVKELSDSDEEKLEKYAEELMKSIEQTYGVRVFVGISSVTDSLRDLAKAYKEARISIEVGKIFDIEKPVMSYRNLGIGRLVYQLPTTLCEIFLGEVFNKGSLESLDRETLMTVQSFFENNLNVSETSRKLFVHRNTLVYRLEKIRKLTGLDLREFDHAVTFKVALMVKKYLTSKPTKF